MKLNSVTTLPPGGWIYTQPGTNHTWHEMGPFEDVVKQITLHRAANSLPRASKVEASEDLQAFTCLRLGNDPQWCQKKTTGEDGSLSPGPDAPPVEADLFNQIKTGASILADWVGEGQHPVEPNLAHERSKTCIACPENRQPKNLFQRITASVAGAIRDQTAVRHELALGVPDEDKLHTCAVCLCHLPLKVWVPHATIMARTSAQEMARFPKNCWLVTENKKSEITPIPIA